MGVADIQYGIRTHSMATQKDTVGIHIEPAPRILDGLKYGLV